MRGSSERLASRRFRGIDPLARGWSLAIVVIGSIALIIGIAVWSSAKDREAAIVEFSDDQALLARAVGIDFEDRLARHLAQHAPEVLDDSRIVDEVVLELLAGARELERDGQLLVMVARPRQPGFLTTDRRTIPSARIRAAIDEGRTSLVIPHQDAPSLGLPRRVAVAGISRTTAHEGRGVWGIVVVASAERLRVRQEQDELRLAITVVFATSVVAALGAIAGRRLLRSRALEQAVAVSTAHREREAALAKADKMATLAALSTGIAHELGTPLSIIVGRVDQVIERVRSDERAQSALRIVLEQVERIERIVRGSLNLARGEAPHLVPTAPALVAHRATSLVRHRFEKANVELATEVDAGLADVPCDPLLLEQALVNVLLNACEATPAGGHVRLRVRAREGRVLFVVDDEGAGIPEHAARRVGDPFFTTKRDQGGSGLGLTIAREIVKHHGGGLELVRREDGPGTRATIDVAT